MGAQPNPHSIAPVVALDYPQATKIDLAENRARTAVLPSVAYIEQEKVPTMSFLGYLIQTKPPLKAFC